MSEETQAASEATDAAEAAGKTARHDEAMDIVRNNLVWGAGAGVLPFPMFDMAAITAVQLKVIKELADLYDVPFRENAAKSVLIGLAGALGSGTVATLLAVSTFKIVPVLGPFMAATSLAATSTAMTYAVGRVFIKHFETGGHLLDLDPHAIKEYFREEFEKSLAEEKAKEGAAKKAARGK